MDKYEESIAEGIHSGAYSWTHAKLTAELQGLNWRRVMECYGVQYEAEQVAGANSWN